MKKLLVICTVFLMPCVLMCMSTDPERSNFVDIGDYVHDLQQCDKQNRDEHATDGEKQEFLLQVYGISHEQLNKKIEHSKTLWKSPIDIVFNSDVSWRYERQMKNAGFMPPSLWRYDFRPEDECRNLCNETARVVQQALWNAEGLQLTHRPYMIALLNLYRYCDAHQSEVKQTAQSNMIIDNREGLAHTVERLKERHNIRAEEITPQLPPYAHNLPPILEGHYKNYRAHKKAQKKLEKAAVHGVCQLARSEIDTRFYRLKLAQERGLSNSTACALDKSEDKVEHILDLLTTAHYCMQLQDKGK